MVLAFPNLVLPATNMALPFPDLIPASADMVLPFPNQVAAFPDLFLPYPNVKTRVGTARCAVRAAWRWVRPVPPALRGR